MPGDTSHKNFNVYHLSRSHAHSCAPIFALLHSLTYTHKSFLMLPATTHLKWICVRLTSFAPHASSVYRCVYAVNCKRFFTCFPIFPSMALRVCRVPHRNHVANSKHDILSTARCVLFVNKIVFHFVFLPCYFDGCLQVLRPCSFAFLQIISDVSAHWTTFCTNTKKKKEHARTHKWNSCINESWKLVEKKWYNTPV